MDDLESKGFGNERLPKTELSAEELEAFKQELAPIFDERFNVAGHGTTKEFAEAAMRDGLFATQGPDISTTAIGLENTDEGIEKILDWPHRGYKAIVVVTVPKEAPRSHGAYSADEHLWEQQPEGSIGEWKLPAKYIKGYIDVENKRFIANDAFEEDPEMPEPISRTGGAAKKSGEGPVDIPMPPNPDGGDNPEVW